MMYHPKTLYMHYIRLCKQTEIQLHTPCVVPSAAAIVTSSTAPPSPVLVFVIPGNLVATTVLSVVVVDREATTVLSVVVVDGEATTVLSVVVVDREGWSGSFIHCQV